MVHRPTKQTDELQDALRGLPEGGVVTLIVELDVPTEAAPDGATTQERVDAMARSFSALSRPVIARINAMGGSVRSSTWLTDSIAATVAPGALEALESLSQVRRLDVDGGIAFDDEVGSDQTEAGSEEDADTVG